MATTVKTGWLNDKNGDKFAPKTLISQVQTNDGILLEDKIQADLDTVIDDANKYTDNSVSGLISETAADTKINTHNTSIDAHNDIRVLISDLITKLNNFLDVDDTTSDQLSEVLTLIDNNRGTLESLTVTKVNVSDIIDNLVTNSTSKVLSAAQGVVIKGLIDALQLELDSHKHIVSDITDLTATATELNYMDGVKSGVQPQLDSKLPLSGGTLTGSLTVNGGDAVGASKIVLETGKGQITNSSTGTLVGYTDATTFALGHSSVGLSLRGSGTRPKYNTGELALKSDVDALASSAIMVLSGTNEPTAEMGDDGDIYIVTE